MTWSELTRLALQYGNLVPRGQDAAPEYNQDARTALTLLLSEWSRDGVLPPNLTSISAILTGGNNTYTAGVGGDFPFRPVIVTQSVISNGSLANVRIALPVRPWDEFNSLSYPSNTGLPQVVFINATYPLMTVNIYPTPDTNYTLDLFGQFAWDNITWEDQTSLPPGFEPAIIDALAIKICENYNREVPQFLRNRARDGKSGIVLIAPAINKARNNKIATYYRTSKVRNWLSDSPV